MATLHLRNVPDDLVDRLRRLAERDSSSVSSTAVRELDEATRRVENLTLLTALPHLAVPTGTTASALDEARADR